MLNRRFLKNVNFSKLLVNRFYSELGKILFDSFNYKKKVGFSFKGKKLWFYLFQLESLRVFYFSKFMDISSFFSNDLKKKFVFLSEIFI